MTKKLQLIKKIEKSYLARIENPIHVHSAKKQN